MKQIREILMKLSLKENTIPLGHLFYSWTNGSIDGCSCEVCNRTWDLDNEYVRLDDLITELDKWEIKRKDI